MERSPALGVRDVNLIWEARGNWRILLSPAILTGSSRADLWLFLAVILMNVAFIVECRSRSNIARWTLHTRIGGDAQLGESGDQDARHGRRRRSPTSQASEK